MSNTPEQRAIDLLELHAGRCFVPADNELVEPFREMEKQGLVYITGGTGQVAGINVFSIGFTPVAEPLDEIEPQAH